MLYITTKELTHFFTVFDYQVIAIANVIQITNLRDRKKMLIPRQQIYSFLYIKLLFYIHRDSLKHHHKFCLEQLRHHVQLNRIINQSKTKKS